MLQRAVAETSAKKYDVDVVHIGSPEMEALAREQVLLPITSPVHKDLQPGSVPAHREWAATLLSVWVQVYNTKLVKKESLPKTYKDLLDPKWKGKLGIEGKDEDWFASVVDVMGGGETGLKFFRDLMATNGLSVRQGHTLLNNMVISGEVPLALNVYNYMPEQAKKKGAPIDWFALEPAIARSNAVGVARHAPHPNAALLFYEYLLGEGQQYFVSMDYVPSNTKVASPLKGIRIVQTDPARARSTNRTNGARCSNQPSSDGGRQVGLPIGTRLGPYKVTGPIGEGGMGEVYRAHDRTLNRDVAVKVLPEALALDPDRLARFQREAQVLASLNHPNIAAIYGFEDSGSVQALVLELVEGPTLADRIAQGADSTRRGVTDRETDCRRARGGARARDRPS